MKTGKRHIENGKQYDYLFPIPKGENKTIKSVADLDDTIHLMKKVIATTLEDTLELSKMLKADTEKQTCSNIWNFCFKHLQYTKDEMGKEQVRRPSRVWQDREKGVDCDCMSVFIGSILTNLGIPYSLRLTKYQSTEFEHVYPIAHTINGVLILDAVVHKFNREVPYSAKNDINMELQYLNGFDNDDNDDFDEFDEFEEIIENDYPMDAQGLIMDEDLLGLDGKWRDRRKAKKAKRQARRAEIKKLPKKERFKARLKQGIHVINRLNPAAALLRLGILASMKLNLMKAASKLRFGYWTDAEARKNNMDMNKFGQLKKVREKMEKIFFGAGGKTENLKKAILKGKGNRDRKVLNGLGEVFIPIHDEDDLKTILGDEIYFDEFVDDSVNGLGIVATASTATAVAAASGIIGTIAALIKKLGSLFKKGSPQAEREIVQENTDNQEEKTRKFSIKNLVSRFRNKGGSTTTLTTKSATSEPDLDIPIDDFSDDDFNRSADTSTDDNSDTDPDAKKGIVGWVKENPLLTAGIAVGVVGGTILVVRAAKKKKGLAGVPKKKKTSKAKSKTPATAKKKAPVKKRSTKPKRKTTTQRKSSVKKIELL
ncbi:MAG: hypothetical protein COA33_013280 [Fluviicola sp.]|nr:hypothetical protein [Fluviicola sp.]